MAQSAILGKALMAMFLQAVSALEKQAGSNPDLMNLVMRTTSKHASEDYAWLGALPQIREWIGEKRAAKLKDYGYSIRNKDFEGTIEVDRNDIEDDNLGAYQTRIRDLALKMKNFPAKLVLDLISAGTSGLAYDGIPYFSNATGGRIIDNLVGGNGVTLANLEGDLDTVIQTMMSFEDASGEKLNIVPNVIVCPPGIMNKFMRLTKSADDPTATASGTFNPYNGKFAVIADARLSDANDWYAFSTGGALQPFIYQERKSATPVIDRSREASTRMIQFGPEMRANVGYGLPHLGVKVVNS